MRYVNNRCPVFNSGPGYMDTTIALIRNPRSVDFSSSGLLKKGYLNVLLVIWSWCTSKW